MAMAKVAITLDEHLLVRLDRMVKDHVFPSRSKAIQDAIADKLNRLDRTRLARECAKLDVAEEQALADEGLAAEADQWPEY